MNKIKIGMMVLSLPPEKSTVVPQAVKASGLMGDCLEKSLNNAGFICVREKKAVQDEILAIESTKRLLSQDVDCLLYMTGSWLYSSIISAAALEAKFPLILFAPRHNDVSALSTTCILHGSLDELGVEHKFIYGYPDDKEVLKEIKTYAIASMVKKRLNNTRYGLYGGRCMYMYTGMPDLIQIRKLFGIETVHISEHILIEMAKNENKESVQKYLKNFKARFKNIKVSDEVLEKSIRLYFALKMSSESEKIDFAGVKCIPECVGEYCSHCLSVSLNNDNGFIVSCEADTNAAITMKILNLMSGKSAGSADVKELDRNTMILRLINCGSLPTDFAKNDNEIIWMEQYDSIVHGKKEGGATASFVCKPGKITLARLARINGEYIMQIATGEALNRSRKAMNGVRDRWPQIFIKLEADYSEFLKNCRSNHLHWVYGDYKDELIELCRLYNIKTTIN